ncbi:MAG: NAD-dependent epimerase/dehydratase family protein [Candidatus Aminicenantes bacterium]|nr:NAD-dependent epimerase/dehydratase family protein [Candidatus Aminicenantes bacterium]
MLYDKQHPQQSQFPYMKGKITDRARLSEAFQGADRIIHLAALRSRYNHLPMKVMATNILGTYCVLETAQNEGVEKLLFSSSDAVLGIAQSVNEFAPEYVPVDEKHPLKPQDPYGISKMHGEEMCRCFTQGYDIDIIALRFSNIFCPEDEQKYLADAKDPSARRKSLWAWVHVEDAVNAIVCALVSDLKGYDVFHIAAEDVCLSNSDIPNLVATYFPKTPIRRPLSDKESLIDCSKAKEILGFQVRRRFAEVLTMGGSEPHSKNSRTIKIMSSER